MDLPRRSVRLLRRPALHAGAYRADRTAGTPQAPSERLPPARVEVDGGQPQAQHHRGAGVSEVPPAAGWTPER